MSRNSTGADNGPVYAMGALVALLVGVMAVVNVVGTEAAATRTATFIGTVVPLVLGYAFLNKKVEQVEKSTQEGNEELSETHERVKTIEGNVNGKLDARFEAVNQRLDALLGITIKDTADAVQEAEGTMP